MKLFFKCVNRTINSSPEVVLFALTATKLERLSYDDEMGQCWYCDAEGILTYRIIDQDGKDQGATCDECYPKIEELRQWFLNEYNKK